MSQISELEARLDALTTAILPPARVATFAGRRAFAQLQISDCGRSQPGHQLMTRRVKRRVACQSRRPVAAARTG